MIRRSTEIVAPVRVGLGLTHFRIDRSVSVGIPPEFDGYAADRIFVGVLNPVPVGIDPDIVADLQRRSVAECFQVTDSARLPIKFVPVSVRIVSTYGTGDQKSFWISVVGGDLSVVVSKPHQTVVNATLPDGIHRPRYRLERSGNMEQSSHCGLRVPGLSSVDVSIPAGAVVVPIKFPATGTFVGVFASCFDPAAATVALQRPAALRISTGPENVTVAVSVDSGIIIVYTRVRRQIVISSPFTVDILDLQNHRTIVVEDDVRQQRLGIFEPTILIPDITRFLSVENDVGIHLPRKPVGDERAIDPVLVGQLLTLRGMGIADIDFISTSPLIIERDMENGGVFESPRIGIESVDVRRQFRTVPFPGTVIAVVRIVRIDGRFSRTGNPHIELPVVEARRHRTEIDGVFTWIGNVVSSGIPYFLPLFVQLVDVKFPIIQIDGKKFRFVVGDVDIPDPRLCDLRIGVRIVFPVVTLTCSVAGIASG